MNYSRFGNNTIHVKNYCIKIQHIFTFQPCWAGSRKTGYWLETPISLVPPRCRSPWAWLVSAIRNGRRWRRQTPKYPAVCAPDCPPGARRLTNHYDDCAPLVLTLFFADVSVLFRRGIPLHAVHGRIANGFTRRVRWATVTVA